jgi:hypothetical protein
MLYAQSDKPRTEYLLGEIGRTSETVSWAEIARTGRRDQLENLPRKSIQDTASWSSARIVSLKTNARGDQRSRFEEAHRRSENGKSHPFM